jgi:WhiB family redox-sensing transcriptional regulator
MKGTDMSNWRDDAACRGANPDLFFPLGFSTAAAKQTADAKAVCAGCAVAFACLQSALESGQDAGVWGGMSEKERRELKRRLARGQAQEVPA